MTSNLTYTASKRKLDAEAKARTRPFPRPQAKCPIPDFPRSGGWGAKSHPASVALRSDATRRAKRVKPSMPKLPWDSAP